MRSTRSTADRVAGTQDPDGPTPCRFVVPVPHPRAVARGRLVDLVEGGVAGALTVVTAPAGSGKTALLASWAAGSAARERTCWYTLQPGDEQPRRFWSTLSEGLRRHGLPSGPGPRGDRGPRDLAADVEAQLLSAREPVVLVLDRVDGLGASTVGRDLADLARRCEHALRLVVLSRADPALQLHLFRLAGELTEIRADALAFTRSETARLLHGAGVHLPPPQLEELHERTAGWPVGLRFAAMALEGRATGGQTGHDLTGAVGDVAEYLASEVLDTHGPRLREVLLRCSVVERLDPGLVETLTGAPDGRRLIEDLSQGNVLGRTVPDRPGRYQLQPLFREFLRARLALEHPGLAAELHALAAARLAADGRLLDSARHACLAGVPERATGRLGVQGLVQLLVGPEGARLATAYAGRAQEAGDVAGVVVGAATALLLGDDDRCARQLDEADVAAGTGASSPRDAVAVAAVRAFLDERRREPDVALASVDAALAAIPTPATPEHDPLRSALLTCRARVLLRRGSLRCARQASQEGLGLAQAAQSHGLLAWATATAALVEALTGRLRNAEDLAGRSARAGEAAGWSATYVHRHAAAALAWVRSQRAEVPAAEDALELAGVALDDRGDPVVVGVLGLVRTRLLRARGDLAVADDELRALRGAPGRVAWLVDPLPADLAEAPVELPDRLDVRVSGLLQDAARLRADHPVQARQRAEHALRLAAPERLRLPFVEVGPMLPELLEPEVLRGHAWLNLDPAPSVRVPRMRQGGSGLADGVLVVDPLTAKEREVLGHLAELLTTEEIAAEMFVSVNTVRTHVRGILRKLAAQRRNEAVRRAWELHLLPRTSEPPAGGRAS
ncbi:LuxR C-terminal-related transcriptional regulator [Aquipuribacter sp. MA13-6]|uniref:LuxR C-terminal-related transcriptional regulator n=1 Tax=unclassified Aquipuribacter TaxID=2635084 RepID=UPI003EE9C684